MTDLPNGHSTLESVIAAYEGGGRSDLLPMLHDVQALLGWLPESALEAIGQALRVPLADIHGVVEFYTLFYNQPVGKRIIRVCADPSCALGDAESVLVAACKKAGIANAGETSADGEFTVERMTCLGLCDQAPVALVNDMALTGLTVADLDTLFTSDQSNADMIVSGEPRILTDRMGDGDPLDLAAYRQDGGFAPLEKALTSMSPDDVIDTLKASNLLGRGGAAFPTGLKWQFTRGATATPKYVVCNADESEPGTFKDRMLMEGAPYQLIEGLMLCGYAIGAETGYLFIRGEYPQAVKTLKAALDNCREAGLLGTSILGSTFNFDIIIRVGAGAYICGEETALFEAIEGKRGFPRVKPPFPTTHGLFGKPTAINNVETLSTVPHIVRSGGEWFHQWGTANTTGIKLFCVSGHVNKPGLVEAPLGLKINELIDTYCGGFKGDPQAILLGGAAGVFLKPEHFDTPLTYEDLRPLDAFLGSGAIMVFNKTVDLKDVLQRLGHFFAHESCGKCYPCQLGTQRQMEILERVAEGHAQKGDTILLQDIAQTMTDASICGLGQTAGSAVLSAIQLWPDIIESTTDH